MKNITFLFILFAIITTSCKKNEINQKNTEGELHNIKFSTSGFTQQNTTLATNSLAENAVLDGDIGTKQRALLYAVYNDQGTLVRNISQIETDANFGTITDKLPVGTYSVFFIGGYNFFPTVGHSEAILKLFTPTTLSTAYAAFSSEDMRELFAKQITLSVTTEDVNQTVTLDRVGGLLDVNILDAIPSNVTSIRVIAKNYAWKFKLSNFSPVNLFDNYSQKYTTTTLVGTSDNHFVIAQLNTFTTATVTITAFNDQTKIAEKVISNVWVKPNKKTILTGNLFGGTLGTGGLDVGGDPTWNPTPIVKTF